MKKYISLYIIALLLSTNACSLFLANNLASEYKFMFEKNTGLKRQIVSLEKKLKEAEKYKAQIDILTRQNTDKTNRGGERSEEYTITAYCDCEICCGRRDRPGGIVKGAAGVELVEGISIAAPLPFGTKVIIDGHTYIVQDRTSKAIEQRYGGKIIDIYVTDHERAKVIGKAEKDVYVLGE